MQSEPLQELESRNPGRGPLPDASVDRPRPAGRAGGFTLLEVLLALIVLGIAIVGIAQGFAVGIRANAIARGTTTALELARAKLAEIDAGLLPVTQNDQGDFKENYGEPDYKWTLNSKASQYTGLYELTLTVEWPDRGETRSLTVVQWMLDRQAGALAGLQAGTGTSSTPKTGTATGGGSGR